VQNKKKVKLQRVNIKLFRLQYRIVFFISIVFLCSCGSIDRDKSVSSISSSYDRSKIVKEARHQIGDKYKYGAKGPKFFDCSGLVSFAFDAGGINLGGSASHIFSQGKSISLANARPGDLVFFKKDGRIFHVSIISIKRNNQLWVVHSTSSNGVIEEDVMASLYWKPMIYKLVSLSSLSN